MYIFDSLSNPPIRLLSSLLKVYPKTLLCTVDYTVRRVKLNMDMGIGKLLEIALAAGGSKQSPVNN